jgi:AraC-like DNA-binding protein
VAVVKDKQQLIAGFTGGEDCLTSGSKTVKGKNNGNGRTGEKDIVDFVARYILGLRVEELREIKIKDICRTFEINASFLSRKFKARNNCTLCEFIQMEKIQRAVILLHQVESLSIGELSERLGYSSTEYFIRSFKKKMGVPPNTYRKLRQWTASTP